MIKRLKGIYNHLMAISDSKQLEQEKLGKELLDVIGELQEKELEKEDYEEKYLIKTLFGYIYFNPMNPHRMIQSSYYTKEYFYTMEEIERFDKRYKEFALPIDRDILAGL